MCATGYSQLNTNSQTPQSNNYFMLTNFSYTTNCLWATPEQSTVIQNNSHETTLISVNEEKCCFHDKLYMTNFAYEVINSDNYCYN